MRAYPIKERDTEFVPTRKVRLMETGMSYMSLKVVVARPVAVPAVRRPIATSRPSGRIVSGRGKQSSVTSSAEIDRRACPYMSSNNVCEGR